SVVMHRCDVDRAKTSNPAPARTGTRSEPNIPEAPVTRTRYLRPATGLGAARTSGVVSGGTIAVSLILNSRFEPATRGRPTAVGQPSTEGIPSVVGNAGRRPEVTRSKNGGHLNVDDVSNVESGILNYPIGLAAVDEDESRRSYWSL